MRLCAITLAALLGLAAAFPASARDDLGVYSGWAAFRDPNVPRCYAIAKAEDSSGERTYKPYAAIGTWPKRQVRGQLHIRLSRKLADNSAISLRVGQKRFTLIGGGGDAWADGKAMDAAVVAAMRAADRMYVSAVDERGRRFTDSYRLVGAATAMDAATVGCSNRR